MLRASRLYGNLYIRRRLPVLVYSVERSGSVALFSSIERSGVLAVATHYLTPAQARQGNVSGTALWAWRHLIGPRKPLKVMSLVRDPIANMISSFAREDLGRFAARSGSIEAVPDPVTLSRRFVDDYLVPGRFEHPLRWFDTEFSVALGVDVYRHPFDTKRRYARFTEGPYDVLVLRTELPDAEKSQVVSEFLGAEVQLLPPGSAMSSKPALVTGRPGDQAPYADQYRVLKRAAVVPEPFLGRISGSRFARHFFSEAEIQDMRERFSGPKPTS